jgi:ABC-type transport system involved in multi-copper enzyme maturation permease subunit
MVCLLVPLLISMLLAVILLTTSTSLSLNADDFLRITGIIFTSIVYLSVFYLIGMLISAMTRRTATALMLSMFVWGLFVLVYPNVILAALTPHDPPETRTASTFSQIENYGKNSTENINNTLRMMMLQERTLVLTWAGSDRLQGVSQKMQQH